MRELSEVPIAPYDKHIRYPRLCEQARLHVGTPEFCYLACILIANDDIYSLPTAILNIPIVEVSVTCGLYKRNDFAARSIRNWARRLLRGGIALYLPEPKLC